MKTGTPKGESRLARKQGSQAGGLLQQSSYWAIAAWIALCAIGSAQQYSFGWSNLEVCASSEDWVICKTEAVLTNTACCNCNGLALGPNMVCQTPAPPPFLFDVEYLKFSNPNEPYGYMIGAVGPNAFYVRDGYEFQLWDGYQYIFGHNRHIVPLTTTAGGGAISPELVNPVLGPRFVWNNYMAIPPGSCGGWGCNPESGTLLAQGTQLQKQMQGATCLDRYGVIGEMAIILGKGSIVAKVPLGGDYNTVLPGDSWEHGGSIDRSYRVYVPTSWGGRLHITTTAGTITDLKYPDGTPYVDNTETFNSAHQNTKGWYTFTVLAASNGAGYTIHNDFVEEGHAVYGTSTPHVPWNFWFYPDGDQGGNPRPQLFLTDGACDHYDIFTHGPLGPFPAKDWELGHHFSPLALNWFGHCYGGAAASIVMLAPSQVELPTFPTRQDMKGLLAEYFNLKGGIPETGQKWEWTPPPGVPEFVYHMPNSFTNQPFDQLVHEFHLALRTEIREAGKPMVMNLRNTWNGQGSPPVRLENWNYACYKYSSSYVEDGDGIGDSLTERPKQILVTTTFRSNADYVTPLNATGQSAGDPEGNVAYREQVTKYLLFFSDNGDIVTRGGFKTAQGQTRVENWIYMYVLHDADDPTYGGLGRNGCVPATIISPSNLGTSFQDSVQFTADDGSGNGNPWVNGHTLTQLGAQKTPGY